MHCQPAARSARLSRPRPTEVWSLGVSLFMFVFGEPPFSAITMAKLYEAIRTQEAPLAGGLLLLHSGPG
jgi:serine/threonine protein kinase